MVGRGRGRGNINSNNYAKSYTTKRLPLLAEYDDSQMSDDMEMEDLGNQFDGSHQITSFGKNKISRIAFSNPSQARQREIALTNLNQGRKKGEAAKGIAFITPRQAKEREIAFTNLSQGRERSDTSKGITSNTPCREKERDIALTHLSQGRGRGKGEAVKKIAVTNNSQGRERVETTREIAYCTPHQARERGRAVNLCSQSQGKDLSDTAEGMTFGNSSQEMEREITFTSLSQQMERGVEGFFNNKTIPPQFVDEDDDETQAPDDMEIEEPISNIHEPLANVWQENSTLSGSNLKKKGRGKYKCINLDKKTQDKKVKLSVTMANNIDRAVGNNARHLSNHCGYVVRTIAPLDVQNWQEAYKKAGTQMMNELKEYFIISDEDDRLNNFCIATMQRIYKTWKNKLHGIYKSYKTDNERLRNRPDDVEEQYWNHCVKHFGSEKFKKISAQNSNNAKKRKQKHTTGNVSFAETEERMVDPITNEKPSLPIIWLRQHTRKTQEGGIEWADEYSKKIGEQLEQLVDQNSIEGEIPMTNEELYDQVMGVRSGYRRGFGYGKKGFRKNACQNEKQQQRILELEQQLQELQDQFDNEHEQQKQREKEFETKIRDQVLKEMQDILKQNPLNFSNYTAPVLDDTLLEEE